MKTFLTCFFRIPLAKILLAFCFYLNVLGPALAGRVALVIGNNAYVSATALSNPVRDANAIAERLTSIGFDVVKAFDVDLAGMRAALTDFGKKSAGAEIAMIFYAGHGLQVGGENFLVPIDARLRTQKDIPRQTLSASEIFSQLLASGPQAALLILDACRDNPVADKAGLPKGLSTGGLSATAFVQRPNSAGMIIGFAAAPGAVAYDGEGANSPYTTALLQWIDRPGLDLATMLRRVRGTVVSLTGGIQVPWVEEALLRDVHLLPPSSLGAPVIAEVDRFQTALRENINTLSSPVEQAAATLHYEKLFGREETADVSLAKSAPTEATPTDVPSTVAPPAQVGPTNTVAPDTSAPAKAANAVFDNPETVQAALIWLSIRSSSDTSLYETYLERFPNSPLNELARERLSLLRSSPPVQDPAQGQDKGQAAPAVSEPPKPVAQEPTPPTTDAPVVAAAPTQTAKPVDFAKSEQAIGLGRAEITAVQQLLAQGGDFRGSADGRLREGTRSALRQFQVASALPGTGYLDGPTLQALVSARARPLLRDTKDATRRQGIHRVAAIAERGPGSQPLVLRVAQISRNEEVHAYWGELARRFEADHPGTLVDVSHQPDWQFKSRILSMLGSATPPDLIHTWGGGHLNALREAGFVRELTDEIANGWALEIRPSALQGFTRDGAIFGVPSFIALAGLWVNEPLLRRAGVSIDQLENWDGFLDAIRKLRAKGITPIALGGRDKWPAQLLWGNIALSIGGRDVFALPTGGEDQSVANPVFVEASQRLRTLYELKAFLPQFEDMDEAKASNAFARGEAAMVITGNWRFHSMGFHWPGGREAMARELKRVDFSSAARTAGAPVTYGGVDGYAVNARSPRLAVDLLRLFTSREAQARVAALSTAIPTSSGADLSTTDPLVLDTATTLLASSFHQLYLDQLLGPISGEVVNDVSFDLVAGKIASEEAARRIGTAFGSAAR